jgi:hypothetical protein
MCEDTEKGGFRCPLSVDRCPLVVVLFVSRNFMKVDILRIATLTKTPQTQSFRLSSVNGERSTDNGERTTINGQRTTKPDNDFTISRFPGVNIPQKTITRAGGMA